MHPSSETDPLLVLNSALSPTQKSKELLILIVCSILTLSTDFGIFMLNAPQTAVFEEIVCRNYQVGLHQTGTGNATLASGTGNALLDPNACKSEAVQGELAIVIGYKATFDVIPGLLLSLPYGILSDHWGRKPVLCLCLLGLILGELWVIIVCIWSNYIPLRMVWLSSLFKIIGGGDPVISTIVCVIIADVFSENERSTALFRLNSAAILAEILATPISAYLMTFSLMLPYLLGVGFIVLGTIPVVFLPETLEDVKLKQSIPEESDRETEQNTENEPVEQERGKKEIFREFTRQSREFIESTRFIWSDSNVCIMILVFFVTIIGRQSTHLLLQYVSKKFDWSIARSSLLISLRGIFSLFTYSILMPGLSVLAIRYLNLHGKYRDHLMSKWSGVLSIIGFAAIFLAPTPAILISGQVILSIGSSFLVTTRSLVTALALPDHVGTLYSAIAIAQSVGVLVAGPLFASLFRLGMHLGDAWMGLPFLQASLFFALAVTAVWRIRLAPPARAINEEEQESLLPERC
ncbi:unnamed protein product [Penicillium egyptiacum]|uniref:Major facilitator superfamily (MFS) profile domain-containing protein n=1 Tax=Penicillium egyptiacum TaxID=1303716 RepID=A0A9W4P8K9_9EURO|nr:unnamed protein product [Penicillium egyptiacum]